MFKENIYDLIIKYPNLNDNILHKYGYSDQDINDFIKKRILIKYDDVYIVGNTDSLFKYYNQISKQRDYKKQGKILDLILSIEPNHYNALRQRFFVSIKTGDNETALYCYKKIFKKFKNQCRFDALYELYLLSKLIYVGEDLDKELDGLTLRDVRIPLKDTRYKDIELKNQSREKSLHYDFEEAYNMVYAENGASKKLTFQELNVLTLLNRVVSRYENGKNYAECIEQGRYEDALYSINKKSELSKYDKLIIKLLNFIINPPEEVHVDYNHEYGLWESIEANDFNKALEMSMEYNKDKKIDDSTSPMSNLLREIINMLSIYVNCDNLEDERLYGVYYISNLIDKGCSFEQALNISGLELKDKLYAILIYAKEAYKLGNIDLGDKLLSLYHKTNRIDNSYEDLYQEINDNKEKLINSPSELSRTLSMPIIPKNK